MCQKERWGKQVNVPKREMWQMSHMSLIAREKPLYGTRYTHNLTNVILPHFSTGDEHHPSLLLRKNWARVVHGEVPKTVTFSPCFSHVSMATFSTQESEGYAFLFAFS